MAPARTRRPAHAGARFRRAGRAARLDAPDRPAGRLRRAAGRLGRPVRRGSAVDERRRAFRRLRVHVRRPPPRRRRSSPQGRLPAGPADRDRAAREHIGGRRPGQRRVRQPVDQRRRHARGLRERGDEPRPRTSSRPARTRSTSRTWAAGTCSWPAATPAALPATLPAAEGRGPGARRDRRARRLHDQRRAHRRRRQRDQRRLRPHPLHGDDHAGQPRQQRDGRDLRVPRALHQRRRPLRRVHLPQRLRRRRRQPQDRHLPARPVPDRDAPGQPGRRRRHGQW